MDCRGQQNNPKFTCPRYISSALVCQVIRKWKREGLVAESDTHIHHLFDVFGYGIWVMPRSDPWTPLGHYGRFILSYRLYSERCSDETRKIACMRNRKKEHAHHITRFSNVLHFDVAGFDIFQQCVCAFGLKMLHPQREHKCPPLCEQRL